MNRAWRAFPPLGMGLLALLLLIWIFPSALHIPINGPNGAAEIAPVPGQSHQQANLSQGSLANSGTVGSGGSSVVGGGSPPSPPAGGSGLPSTNQCVGDPPRQTPDPLSPPCVAGWSGTDNGGATSQGVTRDTFKVVIADTERGSGRDFSYGVPIAPTDDPFQKTVKTFVKYFETHFETYGRHIQLTQVALGSDDPSNQAALAKQIAQMKPFAVFNTDSGGDDFSTFYANTAGAGIMSFVNVLDSENQAYPTAFIQQHSPYVWSFTPDENTMTSQTAHFVCGELVGRQARYAGPQYSGGKRVFGLAYDNSTASFYPEEAQALSAALSSTCGLSFNSSNMVPYSDTASSQAAVAKLHTAGVSTVICLCKSVAIFSAADGIAPPYQPEWVATPTSLYADQFQARNVSADQSAHMLDITWKWLFPPQQDTYWYQSYSAVNPDGDMDSFAGFGLYENLMQLYTAVQRAGPRLSPASVQQGLESFRRDSPGPQSPTGWYGPGDHSFLKDMTVGLFNPTGQTPGGQDPASKGSGCYQLGLDAHRYLAGQWPAQDTVTAPPTPCPADLQPHTNSNADNGSGTPAPSG